MALTKIGSIGINTGIAFAGVTTIVTLNGSDAVLSVGGTVNFVSDVSIGGTVSIAGTLTYEDVTNVDAVGLITARDGIVVGSGITLSKDGDVFFTGIATGNGSGLTALNASNLGSGTVPTARLGSGTASSSTFLRGDSTFQTVNTDLVSDTSPQLGGNLDANDKNILIGDSDSNSENRIRIGDSQDLDIFHDGNSKLQNSTGELRYQSDTHVLRSQSTSDTHIKSVDGGAVELYHDNSKKIETTGTGAVVTGIVTATEVVATSIQTGGRKNIIINGAMKVAQRGTSFTNISDTGVIGSVDRIVMVGANLDELAFAGKQTSDGPDGFSKCFEFDVTTAENALDANDLVYMRYKVEGQDLTHLFNANGTGKNFTLSFYVKAYQTGTYQLNIYKNQGPRFISKTYTVDASATWQRVVIPFTGDTGTSGMNDDNGNGFQIAWMFAAGSNYTSGSLQPNWGSWPGNSGFAAGHAVNTASSANNYFRITGIQLELGSQATAFEHRSFGEELALCQRYFFKNINESGESGCNYAKAYSTSELFTSQRFPVAMRTSPTITAYGNAGTAGTVHKLGSPDVSYTSIDRQDRYGGMRFNSSSAWATGDTDMYSYTFQADAEL